MDKQATDPAPPTTDTSPARPFGWFTQGFTYNFGRAVGAVFPTIVGFLASTTLGLSGAMIFGAVGYLIAVVALFGLPETRGIELR
jgi:hypothetical protein